MSEKQLYQQKMEAQLNEWKADVDKLRAKASGASADTQLKLKHRIRDLEKRIEEGRRKLAELAKASEDAWDSLKEGIESAWGALKAGLGSNSHKS